MKAAKLTEHPSFRLLRQTDVQNVWHMQIVKRALPLAPAVWRWRPDAISSRRSRSTSRAAVCHAMCWPSARAGAWSNAMATT